MSNENTSNSEKPVKEINEEYNYNNRKDVPYIEKENGDIKFKEKNFDEAMRHYSKAVMGIKILLDDNVLQTEEEIEKYVKEIGKPCYMRLSFCYLKKEDWKNVIYYCNKVIDIEDNNEKSLYRRCHAYIKIKDFNNALKDLKTLENIISGKSELEDLKKSYEDAVSSAKNEEKLMFKKMIKQYKTNEENKQTQETIDRMEGLIQKLPRAATSLINLGFNYSVVYPFNFFVSRPISFIYNTAFSVCRKSKNFAFSIVNRLNPFSSHN